LPVFVWEGKTNTGESRRGQIEAPNDREARSKLRAQHINPTSLKKKGFELKFELPAIGSIPKKQIVIFTRQFATMIDAGLPLVQCLELLAQQEPNRALRKVLLATKADVESGSTFADALRKHPRVFDELFVNLVAAGEVGGILDTIMNRLATYIEKNMKLLRQVKGAMTYPIGVLVVAVLVVLVLMWKVIPVFQKMFMSFGGNSLPAPTQFVVNLSQFFVDKYYVIIGLIVGTVMGIKAFLRNPKGRELFDNFVLKVPIFGPVIRKVAVAKFTRTLGTMIASGVPILDALDIVAKSSGNKTVEAAVLYTRDKISEGKPMAEPLMETQVFPQMVVQMIAVGESTGALDVMLSKIADFYEEEVDVAVSALTSLMEPLMMVFLGGIVGGMMIAMYLPIFEMAGNIKAN